MSDERSKRVANNKSLRIIKAELEALNERGFITDQKYDEICATLPSEAPLHGSASASTPAVPTPQLASLSIDNDARDTTSPAPPSYARSPPPPPPPRNEVGHAVALYRYQTPDSQDLSFEVGDHISVTEFVNNDWWLGKNVRTGKEGIFPKNYVRQEASSSAFAQPSPTPSGGYYNDSKGPINPWGQPQPQAQPQGFYPGQQPQPYYASPPPPHDPYASSVPPVAIAEQPTEPHKPNKGAEMGKKFGKKLGNAAIFGAGATIGGNIVNSIF